MVLGLSFPAFTALHVTISLVGIGSGVVVLLAMLLNDRVSAWTAVFLASTILTSVTGFLFPFTGFGPPHLFGILSLIALSISMLARYAYRMVGAWRLAYVLSALVAFYLNTFVGVVQLFEKFALFRALAPTGSEPPFAIAQGTLLAFFAIAGFLATRRFRPAAKASPVGIPLPSPG